MFAFFRSFSLIFRVSLRKKISLQIEKIVVFNFEPRSC